CAILLCSFFVPISPGSCETRREPMSEDGGGDDFAVPRDAGGRYVPGSSGHPAGKPRGFLNRATRLAAALLEGEAEALWRTEIDLAKAGDRMLLKHCTDRLLGPQ